MKKTILLLVLCFASSLFGDVTYSHFYPNVPKTLNLGSDANEWALLEVNDVNINNELRVWNDANIYGALSGLTELQVDSININSTTITAHEEESTSLTLNADTSIQFSNKPAGNIATLSVGRVSPASNSLLHVYAGDSGATGGAGYTADAVAILERNNHTVFMIMTPNNKQGLLGFGDGDDTYSAGVTYDHNADKMWLYANNGIRMTIESGGEILMANKVAFTQADLNEYIDSLNDGYMDYRATTAHRFGNGTNETQITAAGDITFGGTARIDGLKLNIVGKTSAYTAATSDDVITCGAGDETFTITLPAVSAANTGKVYHIKNVGTGVITVDGNGAETIDNATTAILTVQYESITIQADGSEWWIL